LFEPPALGLRVAAAVKGIGELGNVGTNAAVCNAISTLPANAKLPVRLEKLEI